LTINVQQDPNGWWYVSGVASGNDQNGNDLSQRRYPLGQQSRNKVTAQGVHHWGLDTSSPTRPTVRLYFDPKKDLPGDLGYVQFGEVTSAFGEPIPPDLLPGLAAPYEPVTEQEEEKSSFLSFSSSSSSSERRERRIFLDFLGPALASTLVGDSYRKMPFYAYTNSLSRRLLPSYQDWNLDNYGSHPLPNGSIRLANMKAVRTPAVAPSLRQTISPFFPTPEAIAAAFPDDAARHQIVNLDMPNDFRIAVDAYAKMKWPVRDLRDVQAVGPYLVFTMAEQGKAFASVIVIFRIIRTSLGTEVLIWLTDRETFNELEHAATLATLDRVGRWLRKNGERSKWAWTPPPVLDARGRHPRGWGGLESPHEMVEWSDDLLLTLNLYSVLFQVFTGPAAATREGPKKRVIPKTNFYALSGVRTQLQWSFDRQTERIVLTAGVPKFLKSDLSEFNEVLARYQSALAQYRSAPNAWKRYDPYMSMFSLGGAPFYDAAPEI
jgi:hypothetical protein